MATLTMLPSPHWRTMQRVSLSTNLFAPSLVHQLSCGFQGSDYWNVTLSPSLHPPARKVNPHNSSSKLAMVSPRPCMNKRAKLLVPSGVRAWKVRMAVSLTCMTSRKSSYWLEGLERLSPWPWLWIGSGGVVRRMMLRAWTSYGPSNIKRTLNGSSPNWQSLVATLESPLTSMSPMMFTGQNLPTQASMARRRMRRKRTKKKLLTILACRCGLPCPTSLLRSLPSSRPLAEAALTSDMSSTDPCEG